MSDEEGAANNNNGNNEEEQQEQQQEATTADEDAVAEDLWGDAEEEEEVSAGVEVSSEQQQEGVAAPERDEVKAESDGVREEVDAGADRGADGGGGGEEAAGADDYNDVFGSDGEDERRDAFGGGGGGGRQEVAERAQTIELSDLPQPDVADALSYVRLPPSLSVVNTPFSKDTFTDEHVRKDSTIRWRYIQGDDGDQQVESNARMVRWSDGSLTLHVGKDVFAASELQMERNHHHIFVRQKRNTEVSQCHGTMQHKLLLKPVSGDVPLMLAGKVSQKMSAKDRRARRNVVLEDGEEEMKGLIQVEVERIRRNNKVESVKKRSAKQYGSKLTTEFIEPVGDEAEYDENYDGGRKSPDTKRRRKAGAGGRRGRDSSSSESSSSSDEYDSGSDSSEAEVVVNKTSKNKRVIESDSD